MAENICFCHNMHASFYFAIPYINKDTIVSGFILKSKYFDISII